MTSFDLSADQYLELYGVDSEEDEYVEGFEPDFSKWCAVELPEGHELRDDDEEVDMWYIVPRVYWDNTGFIPDFDTGFKLPGLCESCEHLFEKHPNNKSQQSVKEILASLGFEIIQKPVWGWDRKNENRN